MASVFSFYLYADSRAQTEVVRLTQQVFLSVELSCCSFHDANILKKNCRWL